ncbi:hypothetical protein DFS34DRAFT_419714 [Phlyctochytrium arcticum]|nr:hypothetical protein DFS34DRAFT_419714 [Phlyctochytrium arcticum]
MQCPHGKPWGHCFVADCARQFNHSTTGGPATPTGGTSCSTSSGPSFNPKNAERIPRPSQPGRKSKRPRLRTPSPRTPSPPPSASSRPQEPLLSSSPMREGEAIQGHRRQKKPCDCHLLDSTIQNMTVHYRSSQRECLLHGKSLAERKELKRQITRIKTGKPVRSSTGSAHSKSSTSCPLPGGRPTLSAPSQPLDLSVTERPPTVVNETDQVDEEQEVQEDQMGENEEQQEQEESNAKSKFSVKLGLTKTVKSDAMGERIVDAVLRFN